MCPPICPKARLSSGGNERYDGRLLTLVGSFRLTIACPFLLSLSSAQLLAILQPEARDAFSSSLRVFQDEIRSGVVPSRARAANRHWECWVTFCHEHYLNPFLFDMSDPVPVLQVFATRYRSGEIAPSGQPVRPGTVDDALRAVGQGFAHVGAKDIRKNTTSNVDFRIQRQIRSWEKQDDPPT
jgi:hypothetical protein